MSAIDMKMVRSVREFPTSCDLVDLVDFAKRPRLGQRAQARHSVGVRSAGIAAPGCWRNACNRSRSPIE